MAARGGGRGNRGRRSENQVTLDMFQELQGKIQHLTEIVTQGTNSRRNGSVHGFDRAREVEDEVNRQFNGGSDGSSDEISDFGRPARHNEGPPWWDDRILVLKVESQLFRGAAKRPGNDRNNSALTSRPSNATRGGRTTEPTRPTQQANTTGGKAGHNTVQGQGKKMLQMFRVRASL
ncbi:hypothetical protein Acr_25g0000890 [Actinidia rufa]|uniref:Uncharacterized protein n=1 Tax=Actinidia rufa TaxID=165716 RepID=A0A7J0GXY0_9ERIC|nr:hypothetical protein Acr_25g0000890 [Actinidia rufa]